MNGKILLSLLLIFLSAVFFEAGYPAIGAALLICAAIVFHFGLDENDNNKV